MATRVLLLVMMTTLFAAAWTNDHSRRSLNQPVRGVRLEGETDATLPVATTAEPVEARGTAQAGPESASPAAQPRVDSAVAAAEPAAVCITPQEISVSLAEEEADSFAELCGGGAPPEVAEVVVSTPVAELPHEAHPVHGDLAFIERERLAQVELARMEPAETPAAVVPESVETVHEQEADIFADCELPLPARMAAGEYRIVTDRGEVLLRNFSSQELTWLGSECDPAAAACQEITADGVVWYFIRVNAPSTAAPAAPQIADDQAEQPSATELTPEARAALRMAVSHLDRRASWLGSRLTEAARGPGRLVRLMESLLLPATNASSAPAETLRDSGMRHDVAARTATR